MIRFRFIRLCFLVLISSVIAHAARRRLRKCWNSTLPINRIKLDIKSRNTLKVLPDGNVKVYMLVNWTLSGANDSEFDGYLVMLRDGNSYSAIHPLNDCEASQSQLWFQTNNATDCSVSNQATDTTCSTTTNHKKFCLCDLKTCPFANGLRCISSIHQMSLRFGDFFSIPSTKRSIQFEIKYNSDYSMDFFPYFRQYLRPRSIRHIAISRPACAEDLSSILNIDLIEASVKCCENHIELLSPIDVYRENFILDEGSGTFNVSVHWIAPVTTTDSFPLTHAFLRAESQEGHIDYEPKVTEVSIPRTNNRNKSCSSIGTNLQSLVAYNLLPNTSYSLRLTALHDGANRRRCRYGHCTKTIRLFAGMKNFPLREKAKEDGDNNCLSSK